MTKDYLADVEANNPAFFLHLGDVIYGHEKETLYRDEFYRPYKDYPGKILAVAGNHDGEIFAKTDPTPLKAFLETFCAKSAVVPPIADEVRIFRQTMTQPGVYWLLNCPFLQISDCIRIYRGRPRPS
jgi:calcineurin-like phosphoesterase family protein